LGIDQGKSWAYNTFLGLVPRAVWPDKPIAYGSVKQQEYIYPEWFESGHSKGAIIPVSFAVDFLFGFGVAGAVVLSLLAGAALGVLQRRLWDQSAEAVVVALSLYSYVFLFNFVRGGTGIAQGVVMLLIVFLIGMPCAWRRWGASLFEFMKKLRIEKSGG
jgi:hypothetical protein